MFTLVSRPSSIAHMLPYAHAYLCVAIELTDFQNQTKRGSFPVRKGALS